MSRIKAFFFLCRCLSEESGPARGLSLADEIRRGLVCWECVVQIASEYLMTVALYCALMEKGLLGLIPADLLEYFELIHSLNGTRNRGIVEQTVEIAGILNRIGVEPLLFKGAGHIGSGLYGDAAMRIVYDIDILVPEECAVECEECLIAAGYRGAAVAYRPDAHFHGPILRREGRTAGVELRIAGAARRWHADPIADRRRHHCDRPCLGSARFQAKRGGAAARSVRHGPRGAPQGRRNRLGQGGSDLPRGGPDGCAAHPWHDAGTAFRTEDSRRGRPAA
jgi:hypothetical protein